MLLLAVFAGSLAVLYRVAPDRDAPRLRWVSLGSVIVTVIWALVSVGFSLYVDNFGSYDKTYGAIAGVIVLMLWLYLTCYLVLLGAEINSEAEHQTAHDTTTGEPQPMGARDAKMADTLPESPEPTKGDSDPTASEGAAAQRTCDGTNGGLHDLDTACGRPRTSTASSAPSATPAAASIRASAMPGPQRRRERAAGDLADPRRPSASSTAMPGRGMPAAVGAQAPQQPGGAGLLLGEQRLAAPERRLLPADRPAGARLVRRDLARQLVAVQRVAHLGAQGVAGAEPARPDAQVLAGLQHRVPQLAGAVGVDQQLVAVLAGVAGAADGHLRPAAPGAGHERHVRQLAGQPEQLQHLQRPRPLHGEDGDLGVPVGRR